MSQIIRLGLAVVVVGVIIAFGIPQIQTFVVGPVYYGADGGRAQAVAQPQLQVADASRGQTVFTAKCMGCHAPEAAVAPELKGSDLKVKYPRDEVLAELIRTGRHPMPQFTANVLSEQGLVDVVAYLRSK